MKRVVSKFILGAVAAVCDRRRSMESAFHSAVIDRRYRFWGPLLIVCVGILVCVAGWPCGLFATEESNSLSEASPLSPDKVFARNTQKICDHIYLIWHSRGSTQPPFEGNSVLIEQSKGLVVVDAGGAPVSGEKIVRRIGEISNKPVRFLIYTHYHGDHNLGAKAFLQKWPELHIISTTATRQNMTGHAMNYIHSYSQDHQALLGIATKRANDSSISPDLRVHWQKVAQVTPAMITAYRDLSAFPADITFTDCLTLHDSIAPVEIAFLGKANTDGDAIVWMPEQKVIATGDVVVAPIPYASASYPSEWIKVLAHICEFNFDYLVPGHGPVQKDCSYVEKLQASLEEIMEKTSSLAHSDTSIDKIRDQVALEDVLTRFAGSDSWEQRQMHNFFLNAIVWNAVKEQRGEPIVQGHDGG